MPTLHRFDWLSFPLGDVAIILPVHQRIAAALCTAVTDVLLPVSGGWYARTPPAEHLRVRVGRGRATYCQQQRDRYTITFGVRMVAEKSVPALAAQWLTSHEMKRRGYCNGRFTIGELFAHTACHEYAHFIQQAHGWLQRGSVHNRHFYSVLDRLYDSGLASRVRSHLAASWIECDEQMQAIVPEMERGVVPSRQHVFRKGDRVRFSGRGGREIMGRIKRINRVTATVIPEDRRYRVSYYRVPFHLLSKAGD